MTLITGSGSSVSFRINATVFVPFEASRLVSNVADELVDDGTVELILLVAATTESDVEIEELSRITILEV
jgi:hypothetical protein